MKSLDELPQAKMPPVLPRWRWIGLSFGVYPFMWDFTIERHRTISCVCIGPFVVTLHH